ncbi:MULTISPECIES: GNAT family N-acetyltransferase [Kordiimonas]|jgi:RimJ/RimL family protein N-acetyltransferase|uniref:GNAT family N-acetyltransferase n=1 Tax=Kordiimonas TaxID=288021 RepID=UPI00257C886F|nr:GNAT family N-acetyltransferase [Kordiimonas sp. UBA4487]
MLEMKPLTDADLEAYFDLFNDPGLARNAGTVPHPIDLAWARERMASRLEGEAKGEMKDRGFFDDGQYVGNGGYFFRDGELEIGYSVHRNARGRGLATRMARMIVAMAREDRLAGPIVANYFTDNPASGRVLEKLGFVKVGLETGTSMAREGDIESQRTELRGDVHLADPAASDYPILFEQHQDKEAQWQAAGGRVFDSVEAYQLFHENSLAAGATIKTILWEGNVAGYLAMFKRDGVPEVSYWLGRAHWGGGIATKALAEFLDQMGTRNCALCARVAKDHPASGRVLEKCGFKRVGEDSYHSDIRGVAVEEYLYRLD